MPAHYPMTTPETPPVAPLGLSLNNLTLGKERTYFTLVLIISILFWLFIAVTIFGLFYAALIGFFLWLGNGLLTAHLRAEAVRVDERQLPRLHEALREVCQRLGVNTPPAIYLLQAGGALNAFATRFAGREFVVVYSDFLDALGSDSPEMKFILGHELGHIKSGHVLKQVFLAPGLLFPLIGPAYRRAWESSCDRYGAFAAQDVDGAVRAMLTLCGGRQHGRSLSADAFAGQHVEERGFFVSLHELTATYPTLSRRVTDLLALKTGQEAKAPNRNPFAYFLALFMPGGNVGGGSGGPVAAMMMVVMIGLLAAMAIPAFQKVRQASIQKVCLNNERMLSGAYDQFVLEEGHAPKSLADLVGPTKYIKTAVVCPAGGTYKVPPDAQSGQEIYCTVHGSMEDLMRAPQSTPR
jgi:Zn-dependent protease with chaperone function/competence protein ComGC